LTVVVATIGPLAVATVGAFDPATGTFYLRAEAGPGAPDAGVFRYGLPGWLPVAGDWNGDGTTTVSPTKLSDMPPPAAARTSASSWSSSRPRL
jgi:hypothetical protein